MGGGGRWAGGRCGGTGRGDVDRRGGYQTLNGFRPGRKFGNPEWRRLCNGGQDFRFGGDRRSRVFPGEVCKSREQFRKLRRFVNGFDAGFDLDEREGRLSNER